MKSKNIFPESFVSVNDINYFRLKNGQIAVEETNNVIIASSKDDSVTLMTFDCEQNQVNFWKVNNEIHALASSSYIVLPEDTTLICCYSTKNYPDGYYIKYMASKRCGVFYVSDTEVSNLISYKEGYEEITFEDNIFYADAIKEKNSYHVIDESGKLIGSFTSKCKKLKGYNLFYDDKSVIINSIKIDVPGGISSVQIIKETAEYRVPISNLRKIIKVTNNKGVFYYTDKLDYLLGPVHDVKVYSAMDSRQKLMSKHEIFLHHPYPCIIAADGFVYVYEYGRLNTLINQLDVDKYCIFYVENCDDKYVFEIVGFKNDIPIYVLEYDKKNGKVLNSGHVEYIERGHKNEEKGYYSHICKKGDVFYVINSKSEFGVFSVRGKNLSKKIIYENGKVYLFEKDEMNIEIFEVDGYMRWI